MPGFAARAFRAATAPARFALRQTRTNLDTLRALRRDFRDWEPILEQAAEETIDNLVRVLVAAEASLPREIEQMTPNERRRELAAALSRSEQHLLAAFGELYRGWRFATAEMPAVIDNPPQAELRAESATGSVDSNAGRAR